MALVSRRDILGSAAAGGLAAAAVPVAGVQAATAAAEPSPGPGPAQTRAAEHDALPSFRFALEAQAGKVYAGGSAKEATVVEFPVSQAIAGVSMRLEPGGLRELHWHATAAEWAYVIAGHCRITIIDPQGHSQIVDFGPGDVWYFPRGHGHSIQGIGPEECHFILAFDNGSFSEFGTFSISDWIAHTPPEVLAKNFGVPAATFAPFPKHEVYIAQGPVPPPLPADPPAASQNSGPLSHRYRLKAQKPQALSGGAFRLVSAKEFPISTTLTGAVMDLRPGALRELHWHPNAVEWQYYMKGRARMTVFASGGRASTVEFGPGDVGYVPQGYGHYIENIGSEDCSVLLVLSSGDYQSIECSRWMAANPRQLLATNFGVPESTFAGFRTGDQFLTDGRRT